MAVKVPSLLHKMSPTYQKAWYKRNKMPLPAHLTGSVAQASKEVKPSERVKSLRAKSLKAYGATKGTRMGSDDGSGEALRDTTVPLTRDQHSKVQAAARASKAATKAAAPAKPKKPLSQAERLAAIGRAVKKAKSKERFDVATMNPDDMDHDDLRDVHQSLHIGKTYSESVEQIDELKKETLQSYLDKRPAPKIKDIARPETVGKPELRQKDIERANLTRIGRARAKRKIANKTPKPPSKPTEVDYGYGQGRYMGDSVKLEGPVMNEVSKKEAEAVLGGPTREKPKGPAGKHPLGYRLARSAARKAMKGAVDAVHKSMEKTMAKEEVEQVDEAIRGTIGSSKSVEIRRPADQAERDKLASDIAANRKYNKGKIGRTSGNIRKNAAGMTDAQKLVRTLYDKSGRSNKELGPKKFPYSEEVEQIDEVGGLVAAVKKYGEAGYTHDQAGSKKTRSELSVAKKQMTAAAKERGIDPKRAMKVADRITMRGHGDDSYKTHRVGKMKEEVVTEAEGTVAVTPKQKALAAHHGDETRITFGDVIKARLKSAAAKAMKKGN